MDRKVTSNIKFKKYKIVNKRCTNSLRTFLTFQTVINKLISVFTTQMSLLVCNYNLKNTHFSIT
jgi:hypothetical protein